MIKSNGLQTFVLAMLAILCLLILSMKPNKTDSRYDLKYTVSTSKNPDDINKALEDLDYFFPAGVNDASVQRMMYDVHDDPRIRHDLLVRWYVWYKPSLKEARNLLKQISERNPALAERFTHLIKEWDPNLLEASRS